MASAEGRAAPEAEREVAIEEHHTTVAATDQLQERNHLRKEMLPTPLSILGRSPISLALPRPGGLAPPVQARSESANLTSRRVVMPTVKRKTGLTPPIKGHRTLARSVQAPQMARLGM